MTSIDTSIRRFDGGNWVYILPRRPHPDGYVIPHGDRWQTYTLNNRCIGGAATRHEAGHMLVGRERQPTTRIVWRDGYVTGSGNPGALKFAGMVRDVGPNLATATYNAQAIAVDNGVMVAFWKEGRRYIARVVDYNGEMG